MLLQNHTNFSSQGLENLALEEYEQFDDYLEMVVQFGVRFVDMYIRVQLPVFSQ